MEYPYVFDFQGSHFLSYQRGKTKKHGKNEAAWIPKPKASLEVGHAPYPKDIGPNDIVIRNFAIAINPIDWKIQDSGAYVEEYPNILGSDVAGEVVAVGSNIKRLEKGDRVLSHALGLLTSKSKNGGFQLYPILSDFTTAKMPRSLCYVSASCLPLSIATASAGLYLQNLLGLPIPGKKLAPTNSAILIWGGSSSVGSSAIQLAVASGLIVVTTASESNFDYCRALGAYLVFDYHQKDVVEDLVQAMKGSTVVGAYDAVGLEASTAPCAEVLHRLGGGKIASVLSSPVKVPGDVKVLNVRSNRLSIEEPETAKALFHDYIPGALEDGRFKPKPEALVIGDGLNSIQEAMDRQKEGVSARKVVVKLEGYYQDYALGDSLVH